MRCQPFVNEVETISVRGNEFVDFFLCKVVTIAIVEGVAVRRRIVSQIGRIQGDRQTNLTSYRCCSNKGKLGCGKAIRKSIVMSGGAGRR